MNIIFSTEIASPVAKIVKIRIRTKYFTIYLWKPTRYCYPASFSCRSLKVKTRYHTPNSMRSRYLIACHYPAVSDLFPKSERDLQSHSDCQKRCPSDYHPMAFLYDPRDAGESRPSSSSIRQDLRPCFSIITPHPPLKGGFRPLRPLSVLAWP